MRRLVTRLLPDGLVGVERVARVFSSGVLTRYPFQANLFGLPPAVAAECLLGVIATRLSPAAAAPRDFEQFCLQHFGAGIAKHFMIPYNRKLYGVHPREITAEWCQRFVPIPRLEEVVRGAVGEPPPEMGYNVGFLYPRRGGIETLTRAFAARLTGDVRLGTRPDAIDVRRREVIVDGQRLPYRALVSTIPLPEVCRLIAGAPRRVLDAAAKLRCTPLRYLNVATRRPPTATFTPRPPTLTPTITNTPSTTDTPTITPTPFIPPAIEALFESDVTPNPAAIFSPIQFTLDCKDFNNFTAATVFQNPITYMCGVVFMP